MKANEYQFACFWSETEIDPGGQYRRWNIIGAFLSRIFYNFAFLPTEMARLIIHVESTALLNWDTANQLGTRVTEVRRRQLEKRGCVVWVWGRGVLGAWPGALDKWWQETALGSLPDLTNWTPGKGVREQLQPPPPENYCWHKFCKNIHCKNILIKDWILKQRRAIVWFELHDTKGNGHQYQRLWERLEESKGCLSVSAKCRCFEVACSANVVQCK